jgi:hypothetical protein
MIQRSLSFNQYCYHNRIQKLSQNRTDVKALLAVYGLEQFALSAAVHPSEKKIIN